MSLPAPLMFTVGLIDQITKPIAKISNRINDLSATYQAGTMQMASGIGGVVASGFALQNALMPAIEMDRALGEVESLGVRDSALKMLAQNSYEYALKYGASAVDFVRSSYDIQSAIGGLNDADLSRFTMASNVLAKATKADAATVTSYMGTMYGIFKNDAKNMGEGAWIERVTGMTASAVVAFKTDGKKMSDAFAALGASAGLAPLEEQMAIMGTLQATMEGSESATKYKSFLAGVGKAQKALNLQFADANGNMLPMIDILNKIKGKYGDTISVAEGDQLATAFGSQEAVSLVKLLLNDIDGLAGSINQLGKVNGMEQAEKMAAAMTDQSERLSQSWFVIRAAFGAAILPAFNQFVGKLANMSSSVIDFTSKFPNITRWLGYFGIGLLLAVAAGGLFTIMMGAGKMAMTTWAGAAAVWNGAIWLVNAGLVKLRAVMLAVNIAMYANPIGFLIAGIAAAIVAVGAMIYYWDDLKATISEWGWIKAVGDFFGEMITGLKNEFISFYNWIASKLNNLPGVDIELKPIVEPVDTRKLQNATKLPENMPNQQAMPQWMQRQASNDTGAFNGALPKHAGSLPKMGVPEQLNQQLNVQRNLPAPYKPEPLTQQQHLQLVRPAAYVPEQLNQQLNVQRNLPKPYAPENLTQQQHLQLVKPAAYVPEQVNQQLNMQRNLPKPYQPEAVTQKQQLQLVKPADYVPEALSQQLNVHRNLPKPYQPEAVTQQQLQLVKPAAYTPEAVTQQQKLQLVKPATYMPEALNQQLNVQRNLPKPYQPEAVTQQQQLQLVTPAAYVPEALSQQLNVQRNLPQPYTPEKLQQQLDIKPVATDTLASAITPKYNQQAAVSAQAVRKATQTVSNGKTISFGDVIVQNPPKNWSLSELADQQELRTA